MTWRQRSISLLVFSLGFGLGLAVLGAWLAYASHTGRSEPLPRVWSLWLFDANPVVVVTCRVLQRRELCVGLGFDGGPLQLAERAWFVLAQGAPFGIAALYVRSRLR